MLQPVPCFIYAIPDHICTKFQPPDSHLVLPCCSLACLQLIQVPPANAHIAVLFIHALPEALDVVLACGGRLLLGVGVLTVIVGSGCLLLLLLGRSLGGATAEEAADGVTDGGAYRDTTVRYGISECSRKVASYKERGGGLKTYAAVLAIWPKSPDPWLPCC